MADENEQGQPRPTGETTPRVQSGPAAGGPAAGQPSEPNPSGDAGEDWRVGTEPSRMDAAKAAADDAMDRARAGWAVAREHLDKGAAVLAVLATVAWRFGKTHITALGDKIGATLSPLKEKLPPGLANRPVRKGPRPFWKEAAVWAGWGAGGVTAAAAAFMVYVTWDMPSTDDLWSARTSQSITFLDIKNRVILREGAQNAPPVDLTKLPAYVGQAVIAIEDRRFYQHLGVDFEGLTRAAVENVQSGRVVQGGSTITQQLAKNLFLTNERTFRRKAQEIALALWLEGRFTKDEILALYLSRVFFGAGAWGIEAASERYFDKPANQLSLAEAALLAGLLKAPSRMNPAIDATEAKARANVVLAEMVAEGFITPAQRDEAARQSLPISRRPPSGNLGYFREWIDAELSRAVGEERDDLIVETTLDLDAQRAGERLVADAIKKDGAALNVSQGALLSIDEAGGVRAMVGGSDFERTQFNRTTQARRQPGSAFKFYIYLAALERGISPFAFRNDTPVVLGDWAPANYDDEYFGFVPLTFAFAKSLNMVAIELSNEVGGQRVIDTARRLGVRSQINNYRSLALGAQEMTLAELTQSYASVANGGYRVEPHGIRAVRRATGNVIYRWQEDNRERVIDEKAVRGMNLLMSRVVEAGTGTRARMPGRQSAGKTGTGNDYRDAWFVGFSSGLTTGVWIGNDDFRTTKKVTGGSLPASIWRDYMTVALRDTPNRPLAMPRDGDYVVEAAPVQEVATTPDGEQPALVGAPLVMTPSSGETSGDLPEG